MNPPVWWPSQPSPTQPPKQDPLISTAACPYGGWLGGWTLRLTDLQKQIPSPTSNPSHPTTEMAHRQSGGYKEEPGVSVANDHVSSPLVSLSSTCLALLHVFERGRIYRDRIIALVSCIATLVIIIFLASRSLVQIRKLHQFGNGTHGCVTGTRWLGEGFDGFQKATILSSRPPLANKPVSGRPPPLTMASLVDSGLVSHCTGLHACTETRVSECCPIPRDLPTWGLYRCTQAEVGYPKWALPANSHGHDVCCERKRESVFFPAI